MTQDNKAFRNNHFLLFSEYKSSKRVSKMNAESFRHFIKHLEGVKFWSNLVPESFFSYLRRKQKMEVQRGGQISGRESGGGGNVFDDLLEMVVWLLHPKFVDSWIPKLKHPFPSFLSSNSTVKKSGTSPSHILICFPSCLVIY